MKKTISFFLLTLLALYFSSCKEDNWIEWKILNQNWWSEHAADDGFIETESGLRYKIINEGWSGRPNSSSRVDVKYTGTLIDGTVFDSSDKASLYFYNNGAIQGVIEGVCKLKKGGRIQLYIPSSLGYGDDGNGVKIPPYSALIFDITLIDYENIAYL